MSFAMIAYFDWGSYERLAPADQAEGVLFGAYHLASVDRIRELVLTGRVAM